MRHETPEQTAQRLCGRELGDIADQYNLTVEELQLYHKRYPFTFYALCSPEKKDEKNL